LKAELGIMDRLFGSTNYNRYLNNLKAVRAEIESASRDLAHNTRAFLQQEDEDIRMEQEAAGGDMNESLEERKRRHERLVEVVRSIRGLVTDSLAWDGLTQGIGGPTSAPPSDLDDISDIVSLHRVDTADFR